MSQAQPWCVHTRNLLLVNTRNSAPSPRTPNSRDGHGRRRPGRLGAPLDVLTSVSLRLLAVNKMFVFRWLKSTPCKHPNGQRQAREVVGVRVNSAVGVAPAAVLDDLMDLLKA